MLAVVRVLVILDDRSSADRRLGDAVESFLQREDAERFVEQVRGDDPSSGVTCGSSSASGRRAN